MLQLSQTLLNRPVLSLRTGGTVATAQGAIINPNNLKIEGWFCNDRFNKKKKLILSAGEIRDIIPQGIVVNDHDALSEPQDLIRMQEIIELGFELIGKLVVTVSGQKMGKVNDWAADSKGLFIQKIYAQQPFLKDLTGGTTSIDRSQIVEITNRKIVVQDPLESERVPIALRAPAVPAD